MKALIRGTLALSFLLSFSSFAATVVLFSRMNAETPGMKAEEGHSEHYILYTPDSASSYNEAIAQAALALAAKNDSSLSIHRMGSGGKALKAARYMGADGFIVCLDSDDRQTREDLDSIRKAGKPVVIANHAIRSDQPWTIIGPNNHEFGKKIAQLLNDKVEGRSRIAIVYSDKTPGILAERELVEMGIHSIRRPGSIEINRLRTDTSALDAERVVFEQLKAQPDTRCFIFTDPDDTLAGTQTLVDLNLVGTIQVIGFGNSPEILTAIEKGIIDTSLYIPPEEIGIRAFTSLKELHQSGYTSSAVDIDIRVLKKNNGRTIGAKL